MDDPKYLRVQIFMTALHQQSLERSLNHLIAAFCLGPHAYAYAKQTSKGFHFQREVAAPFLSLSLYITW